MTAEEAKKKIMELPGIGDYSSDIVNPHGGFLDRRVVGRYLRQTFSSGKERPNGQERIDKIKAEGIRRWGKWARIAFVYVVHDIPKLSKRVGMELVCPDGCSPNYRVPAWITAIY